MFTSLYSSSQALAAYLTARLESVPTPGLGFGGAGIRKVSLNSPREMREAMKAEGLSVWLYRIDRDETRVNLPDRRVSASMIQPPPLPLRLHYLVTPVTFNSNAGGSPDVEQKIMGRVLQSFHGRPVLSGADLDDTDLAGSDAELHVRLEALTLDEMSRVWEALEGSFQLCISYEVSIVNVEPELQPRRVVPVALALTDDALIVGGAA